MRVQVKLAELSYQAQLVMPIFDVLRKVERLYQSIFSHLTQFGVQLTDIKIESTSSNPGDLVVACYLPRVSSVLRYRLDRYEAYFADPRHLGLQTINDVVLSGMEAVKNVSDNLSVKAHTIVLGIHGETEDGSVMEHLRKHVNYPLSGIGSLAGAGVVYYLGSEGPRTESIILFDRSSVVPNGLFVRLTGVLDGGKVTPTEVHKSILEDFTTILKGFGVELN